MKKLAEELVSRISSVTALNLSRVALDNARLNLKFQKKTVADLTPPQGTPRSGAAVVIAAGPSLHRQHPVQTLLTSGFDGETVCADGALPYCLRNGLVPDYVVTLDPHPTRIVRWFGDPTLDADGIASDDYFRKQDLDPHVGSEEIKRNREIMELVDRHGPRIKAVVATCSSQSVVNRCIDAGMELYWWNPLYDDPTAKDSMARQAYTINKAPCMGTGGNCGSASWVFCNTVLNKSEIALTGMDLGYAPGTPLENTQYYSPLYELYADQTPDAYIDMFNPHTQETWYTDPTYYWYREALMEMIKSAQCVTYNCTEGGTLFGEGINFKPLTEFLGRWLPRPTEV